MSLARKKPTVRLKPYSAGTETQPKEEKIPARAHTGNLRDILRDHILAILPDDHRNIDWINVLRKLDETLPDIMPTAPQDKKREILAARAELEAGWLIERVPGGKPLRFRKVLKKRNPKSAKAFFPPYPKL